MDDSHSQAVLILGMHRSGTSLLASLVQDLGVFLGENLVGPAEGNPRGHFEDQDLMDFHLRALERRAESPRPVFDDGTLRQSPLDFEPSSDEIAEARGILEARERPEPWGWKEPRTGLLVDFWLSLLPKARCLLIYRHPLEVHLSHLRRGVNLDEVLLPGQALRAYTVYNQALLRAARQHRDQFLVIEAHAAFADLGCLESRLRDFLGLGPDAVFRPERFHPEEFQRSGLTPAGHALFGAVFPEQAALYEALQAEADLPGAFPADGADESLIAGQVNALEPLLEGASEGQRAGLLPWLEGRCGAVDPEEAKAWRENLQSRVAEELGQARAIFGEWEQLTRLLEERLAYIRELETLKEDWSRQKVSLEELQGKVTTIWDELVKVGKSWEEQRDLLDWYDARVKALEQENAQLRGGEGREA